MQSESHYTKSRTEEERRVETTTAPQDTSNQSGRGFVGTLKEKLGLGGAGNVEGGGISAEKEVQQRLDVAAPTTPTPAVSQESKEEWRKSEAETVRAERMSEKAQVLASNADTMAAQAEAAHQLKTEAERKAQQLSGEKETAAAEAAAREHEADELMRQLKEAQRRVAEAERRKTEIIEESKRMAQPSKELAGEADNLASEAERQRRLAMDLDRRIQSLRTGRPIKEAAEKEAAAERMRQEVDDLKRAAAGEEQDAQRKQTEADRAAKAATAKVREADEIAKLYWAARDEAKALEDHAMKLSNEAAEEARDARNKRVSVQRLDQRVAKASTEAEKALQRKAEMERQAQELAGQKESAEERAARLEQEAESHRREAAKREEEVRRKVEEVERVRVMIPDTDAARKRAEEARRAADEARAREGGLTSEVNRLEEVARQAEEEARVRVEELRRVQADVDAARKEQGEHWEKAKHHGDRAKELSGREAEERIKVLEKIGAESETRTSTTSTTYKGGNTGGEGTRPAEIGATDLSKTVPERPRATKAGNVDLPVKESVHEYRKTEEQKSRSAVEQ